MNANLIEKIRKEFDEFLDKNYIMSASETVDRARETEAKMLAEYKRHTDNT